MKLFNIFLLSLIFIGSTFAREPIKVLLLSGQNNHNWKNHTTDRFKLTVTNTIEKIDPMTLDEFDVILSNWNLFRHRKKIPEDLQWSSELRDAYISFVKNGKGHVAIHAGSSTFYDWNDYQDLCVATWKSGTHHGPQHEFEVRIEDTEHPITAGLKNFKKWDELWEKIYVSSKGATVLTSSFSSKKFKGDDIWEPSTLISQFGKGRTAYTSLGHDTKAFESPEFRVLLARLVEWAATGEVTIPVPGH